MTCNSCGKVVLSEGVGDKNFNCQCISPVIIKRISNNKPKSYTPKILGRANRAIACKDLIYEDDISPIESPEETIARLTKELEEFKNRYDDRVHYYQEENKELKEELSKLKYFGTSLWGNVGIGTGNGVVYLKSLIEKCQYCQKDIKLCLGHSINC